VNGHERPAVTVDVVVVAGEEGRAHVLLIRRKRPPFAGCWALPGGFVAPHEPLEAAARRELQEETGLEALPLEQLSAFGDPGRDPRGWTISIAFLAHVRAEEAHAWQPRAGSDAEAVGWFALDDPPPLAFDHGDILAHAIRRLAQRPGQGEPMPHIEASQFKNRFVALMMGGHGFPKRPLDRHILFLSAALGLDPQRPYSERELNEALRRWTAAFGDAVNLDHVTLRRYLVDERYLQRDSAGARYERTATAGWPYTLDPSLDTLDLEAWVAEARVERQRKKQQHLGQAAHE
jgi:8-oxo-dGTP diphosphatase